MLRPSPNHGTLWIYDWKSLVFFKQPHLTPIKIETVNSQLCVDGAPTLDVTAWSEERPPLTNEAMPLLLRRLSKQDLSPAPTDTAGHPQGDVIEVLEDVH